MTAVNDDAHPDCDEAASLWCLDIETGLSPEQQVSFDRWHADPVNAEAFQRAAAAWDLTELIGSVPEVVQMRSEALDTYRRVNLRRWQRPRRWYGVVWGAAAATAAGVAALVVAWSAMPDRETFRTAIGERRLAVLQDGSRVALDADSEVQASFNTKRRTLTLSRGRARFDVAHNPLRPFTVAVGNKLVVATGTSFSVERLSDEVHVVLFEGHVAVIDRGGRPVRLDRGGDADAQLTAGRELTMPVDQAGLASVASAGDTSADAWQQGRVSFEDEPLPLAVERMNRYLAEPMVIDDPRAASVRVTGVFDGTNAAGFLEGLRAISGVRAQRRAGKVFLTKG